MNRLESCITALLATLCAGALAACGPQGAPTDEPSSGALRATAAASDSAELRRRTVIHDRDDRVRGRSIEQWTEAWWHWTFAVPAAQNPELVVDGNCAVGQEGPVFFVPPYEWNVYRRRCNVPHGKAVLVPIYALMNDYPCADPTFQPGPGQTLEQFLTQGVVSYNDTIQNVAVTLDGAPVDYKTQRQTSRLFHFTADKSLIGVMPDTCLQGVRQPGVADGWWLMLELPTGLHTVHVTAIAPSGDAIDYTYDLQVGRDE